VLNTRVSTRLIPLFIGLVAALALAAPASARVDEPGKTTDTVKPTCPDAPCLAVTRTTGYGAKVTNKKSVYVAKRDARLVAWSVTLGTPSAKQIEFFDQNYGAGAQARITVMRPGKSLRFRVTGMSPIQQLNPYFGKTVQFPLTQTLTVKKGYVIALTVPTWAPAMASGLDKSQEMWRAARGLGKCEDTQTQTAQQTAGDLAQYRCLYRGVRLTYSAMLISTP
jgi:hypothetical protein